MNVSEITEKIQAVFRRYHLNQRQMTQVNSMVFAACRGERVLFIAPRKAGRATVYRAAREILALLQVEGSLRHMDANKMSRGISRIQIIHDEHKK